ncbi:MAG: hypothetical protein J0H96_01325 [Microbacterium ginsengisoli]|nr:hypothetical protein [Microbacterium ginsengisoli]
MTTPTTRAEARANDYQPTVPTRVRDVAYIGGLVITAAVGLASAVVGIWAPEYGDRAAQTGVAILTATGIIVSGLGVIYRPGAQA